MLLKSIKLKDFRQFKGEQTYSFSTDKDRNVTVFMGDNGTGKTTFAQAFMWCLYGKTDFTDKNLLSRATAQNMSNGDTCKVFVKISLIHNNTEYRITREQTYTKMYGGEIKRSNTAPLEVIYKRSDGQQELVRENMVENEVNKILPEDLAKYFFFDGERIGSMSKDIQSGKSVEFSDAVRRLLGLDSYEAALMHLKGKRAGKKTVIGSYEEQYDTKSDSKVAGYTQAIEEYNRDLDKKTDRQTELEQTIEKEEREIKDIEKEIEQNKESESLARSKQKLEKEIQKIEKRIGESTHNIVSAFQKGYYDFFLQKMITDSLSILAETDKLDKGIPDIHARTIKHLLERGKCICGNEIVENSREYKALIELMDFIPPKSIGNVINDFVKEGKNHLRFAEIENIFVDVQGKLAEFAEDSEKLTELMQDVSGIEDKLSKLQNVGQLQNKLSMYKNNLRGHKQERDRLLEEIGGLKKSIDRASTERRNYATQNENNRKIERYKAYAERIFEEINNDYKRQENDVRTNLEICINEIFKKIYNGGLSLTIDESYNITTKVEDFAAYNVAVETSQAQSISVIFAFIAGVIKMARENEDSDMLVSEAYPLVMDAPLSAFDKTRIKTVCETLPAIAEQVIIFIKDTDGDIAQTYLGDKIGTRYEFFKKNEFETYKERM